jgi:hypothetical protein
MIVYGLSPLLDIHITFATPLLMRVLIMTDEVRTMRCQVLRHVTVNWPVVYAYPEEIRYWNHRNKPY